MTKQDKSRILTLVFLVGFIAVSLGFYKLNKSIAPSIGAVILIAGEFFYVIPIFCIRYKKLRQYEPDVGCWIPIWNEISIMPTVYAYIVLILTVLFFLACGLAFIDISAIATVFGNSLAMSWQSICIYSAIFIGIILCIVRGVAYSIIFHDIKLKSEEFFGYNGLGLSGTLLLLRYITIYIPFIRTYGILQVSSHELVRLTAIYDYEEDEEETLYIKK